MAGGVLGQLTAEIDVIISGFTDSIKLLKHDELGAILRTL